jgi:hypothetical protein
MFFFNYSLQRLKAIINFEKSIDDEKVRIAFNAQLHEDKERKGKKILLMQIKNISTEVSLNT